MKTYEVEHEEFDWKMVVEIEDESKTAQEAVKEMVNFWSGADERLRNNDFNYFTTFVQQLGFRVFMFSLEFGPKDILRMFRDGEVEGYYSMSGERGITIKSIERIVIDERDFRVMAV